MAALLPSPDMRDLPTHPPRVLNPRNRHYHYNPDETMGIALQDHQIQTWRGARVRLRRSYSGGGLLGPLTPRFLPSVD